MERSLRACDDAYCLVIHPTQHFQTLPIPRSVSDTHDTLPTIRFIFNIRNFSDIGCLRYWYISQARLLRYCSSELHFKYMTSKILSFQAIFDMRNFWDISYTLRYIFDMRDFWDTACFWDILHMHDFLNTAHCLSYVSYRPHTALR